MPVRPPSRLHFHDGSCSVIAPSSAKGPVGFGATHAALHYGFGAERSQCSAALQHLRCSTLAPCTPLQCAALRLGPRWPPEPSKFAGKRHARPICAPAARLPYRDVGRHRAQPGFVFFYFFLLADLGPTAPKGGFPRKSLVPAADACLSTQWHCVWLTTRAALLRSTDGACLRRCMPLASGAAAMAAAAAAARRFACLTLEPGAAYSRCLRRWRVGATQNCARPRSTAHPSSFDSASPQRSARCARHGGRARLAARCRRATRCPCQRTRLQCKRFCPQSRITMGLRPKPTALLGPSGRPQWPRACALLPDRNGGGRMHASVLEVEFRAVYGTRQYSTVLDSTRQSRQSRQYSTVRSDGSRSAWSKHTARL